MTESKKPTKTTIILFWIGIGAYLGLVATTYIDYPVVIFGFATYLIGIFIGVASAK